MDMDEGLNNAAIKPKWLWGHYDRTFIQFDPVMGAQVEVCTSF